jgi:hypothetical protein
MVMSRQIGRGIDRLANPPLTMVALVTRLTDHVKRVIRAPGVNARDLTDALIREKQGLKAMKSTWDAAPS